MDTNSVVIITAIIVFAIVIIAAFIRYRKHGSAELTGPFGMKLKVRGENDSNLQKAGISAKIVTSHEGGLLAEEKTGKGIDLEQVDVKDDVILSSSYQQRSNEAQPELGQPSIINAPALSAGGSITIQQFIGNELTTAQQLAFFSQQLGLENYHLSKFSTSQFEAYSNIWKKLQSLRLAGDDLWEEASNNNLYQFGKQLRQVKKLALEDEIYFEDEHRGKLKDVVHDFGQFYLGKKRLIDIRSREEFEDIMRSEYYQNEIQQQISSNLKTKHQYEHLLGQIRIAFRDKLSKL